jgi:hypothetical protein
MIQIQGLLDRCAAAGITLGIDGTNNLFAWPRDKLTDELRQDLRQRKAEIIDLLRNGFRAPLHVVGSTQTTPSRGTGTECMGCRHLLMRYERHSGTRRTFWWRCAKGHELLESRCYGERVMLAPPGCNSFERWEAGQP